MSSPNDKGAGQEGKYVVTTVNNTGVTAPSTNPANKQANKKTNGPSGNLKPSDMPFMRDLQDALVEQKTPYSMVMLYLIGAILITAIIWAKLARVEEVTVGQGTVIPASREQVIQSLEGGILEELNVREGDIVEKGQILLKIDPTRVGAAYREGMSKVIGLKGTIARLRAESYGTPLVFPPDVMAVPSIVQDETQAYNARSQTLSESVTALETSLNLAMGEINLSEPLMKKGLISEVELLRMRRQANEFRLQITERKNKFRADANSELTKYETELAQSVENVAAREDIMNRTTVVAPVRGTINNIKVTTVGGVIQQGGEIMTIIPLEDQLVVEAKIKPSDVAFLHPGLPATVKISAYDFAIYGGLSGVLEHISPDTLKDEEKARQGKGDSTYYRVFVRTDKASLNVKDKVFPIIPGMIATVEIRTGEKTILDYILKPIMKSREAFRER